MLKRITHLAVFPSSCIIGEINGEITTRKKELRDYAKMIENVCYTSPIKPTNVTEALKDEQ